MSQKKIDFLCVLVFHLKSATGSRYNPRATIETNTMASSSNSAMMSTIDSLKGKMSDEVYLELCNKMKELHNQNDNEFRPYCIWYMDVKEVIIELGPIHNDSRFDRDGWEYPISEIGSKTEELYRFHLKPKKQIVMMQVCQAKKIQKDIESPKEDHLGTFQFNEDAMVPFYKTRKLGKHEKYMDHMEVKVYRIKPM